ncbi:hypothetical protein [Thioalkalivibrio sulfidiphilus]|uniref:hypothetical protein n=1 Tax=Thioalkalivibrio sulfidiphilus TaxID=1033854 RepID=UPI000369AE2F|nr:hypothetical protein [Thioalkalivibrio sulfidiphilus]
MYAIIRPFLQLTLLQIGPQDLPASSTLAGIMGLLYLLVGSLLGMPFYGFQSAMIQSFAELVLMAVVVHLALHLVGHPGRFLQTYTSLLGVGVVLGVVMLPLTHSLAGGLEQGGQTPPLISVAYLLMLGWLLAAYGNIIRHALALRRLSFGFGLALLYLILSAGLIELVVGAWLLS